LRFVWNLKFVICDFANAMMRLESIFDVFIFGLPGLLGYGQYVKMDLAIEGQIAVL